MSIPEAGGAVAKAVATAPDGDGSFGAMLSVVQAASDSSTPDAANATDPAAANNAATNTALQILQLPNFPGPILPEPNLQTQDSETSTASGTDSQNADGKSDQVASGDVAAAPPAITQPNLWMAQRDTAKAQTGRQDAPPSTGGLSSAKTAQAAAELPPDETQSVEPKYAAPVPGQPRQPQQTQAPNAPADETGSDLSDASATPAAPSSPSQNEPPPLPGKQIAAETAKPPKDGKTVRSQDDDNDSPSQGDTAALPDLSPRVTAQFLAANASPPQQSTPPTPLPGNPQPKPEQILAATVPATAASDTQRTAAVEKNATAKHPPVSGVETDTQAQPADSRDPRAAATADASPSTASAPDSQGHAVGATDPGTAHGAKSELSPVTPNPSQIASTPAIAANHVTGFDVPAGAVSSAPTTVPSDPGTPVRLTASAAGPAEIPSFDALALKIAAHSAAGDNSFSIRLDPPDLGRIEVNLNVRSDGHAQAELSADKPQTLELLQKDASSLERALKDAGLNLAGGLAFSLKGEGKSQAWRDMQNGSRGRSLQISATDAGSANAAIAANAALAAQAYGLPTKRLDIRV
jgi:flagellar hook-length control protein FliK